MRNATAAEMPTVWMVTDKASQEPSYVSARQGDDEPQVLGPFVYTQEASARQVCADPKAFITRLCKAKTVVEGGDEPLDVRSMTFSSLLRGAVSGFPPSEADAFVLDEGMVPLTPRGALWVDKVEGTDEWATAFKTDGPEAFQKVLKVIGDRMGLDLNTHVKSVSDSQAAGEHIPEKVVWSIVQVVATPEPEGHHHHVDYDKVCGGTEFWVHTHGMGYFNRPELEMRFVPGQFVEDAFRHLNTWAAHSVNDEIKAGQRIQHGRVVPTFFGAIPSDDEFWDEAGVECLRLEPEAIGFQCTTCPPPDGTTIH